MEIESSLLIFRNNLEKANVLYMEFMIWFSLQLPSESCLHPGRIQQDIIINVLRSPSKMPDTFVRF